MTLLRAICIPDIQKGVWNLLRYQTPALNYRDGQAICRVYTTLSISICLLSSVPAAASEKGQQVDEEVDKVEIKVQGAYD